MRELSEKRKSLIRKRCVLAFLVTSLLTGSFLAHIQLTLAPLGVILGAMVSIALEEWLNRVYASAEARERKYERALAEAHWVRGIGTLVDAIERTGDTPERRDEIAELTRILPHVKEHHRALVDDQHLQHLLNLMIKDAKESKELLSAGLIAIENLGWIDALGPLEHLALSGMASRKELSHCLASLQERARAIREHDTLLRASAGDALLVHPTAPSTNEDQDELLRPTSNYSQEQPS